MTSLSNLRTQVAEDYTRDPNFRIWNSNTVDRAINKGYAQVQVDLGFSEGASEVTSNVTLISGQQEYDLPSDFVRLQLAKYSGSPLYKTTRAELERRNGELETVGSPSWYYLFQDKIGFYPIPTDGTVELQYLKSQATITTDQESQLPTVCDDAICLYASYKLYLGVRDANSAGLFLADYEKELNKLRTQLLFDDDDMTFTTEKRESIPKRPLEQ